MPNEQPEYKRFRVTVFRDVRYTKVIEVEAINADIAGSLVSANAPAMASDPGWVLVDSAQAWGTEQIEEVQADV